MDLVTPIDDEKIGLLKAGDNVTLSGTVYTARDAAHKRMAEALANGQPPPFDYRGQVVFYAGPCPAPPGRPVGSIGPTTAGRMDSYAPDLIGQGLKIMVAKGGRKKEVVDAIRAHCGLYLVAVGGVAALLAECVKSCEAAAYEDLGTEAVWRLHVEKMPLVVAVDSRGASVYDSAGS